MMDVLTISSELVNDAKGEVERITALVEEFRRLSSQKGLTASQLARLYVDLRATETIIVEAVKPLSELVEHYKHDLIPKQYEAEGTTSLTTDNGFRVTTNELLWASIPAENRNAAFQWLRENGLPNLVTETVNASTLSATARHMLEEQGKELPDELFKTTYVSSTSVTKVATGKK